MIGRIDERKRYLNVTDGGHVENLGVYELLRRRCKFIIAIDGEQDPSMTFHALTNLQRMATIDLGVTIDIDLSDLRLREKGLAAHIARFCRIRYPLEPGEQQAIGYLLYTQAVVDRERGRISRAIPSRRTGISASFDRKPVFYRGPVRSLSCAG